MQWTLQCGKCEIDFGYWKYGETMRYFKICIYPLIFFYLLIYYDIIKKICTMSLVMHALWQSQKIESNMLLGILGYGTVSLMSIYVISWNVYHFAWADEIKNDYLLNLTFRRRRIVIYSYNKSQRDALFLKFILIKNSTCFGQIYFPSSGVSQHCTHSKRYLSC